MDNETNNPNNLIPESEKIRIVDEALKIPGCPIPPEVTRSLTKELKLDLFDKLVAEGAMQYTPYQQKTATNSNRTFAQNINQEQPTSSEIYSVWDSTEPYSIIGTDIEEDIEVALSQGARLQTTYLIGASGTGKTTLDANLVTSDVKNGLGVAVLDPHGDLIKTIIAALPENRVKDVIYVNIEDVDHPIGLNLYECQPLTIRDMAKTASFVSHAFEKIWGQFCPI